MTSNLVIDDEVLKKLDEKMGFCVDLESEYMNSTEYQELFDKAKGIYPEEYGYLIHLACIAYFNELNDKKI